MKKVISWRAIIPYKNWFVMVQHSKKDYSFYVFPGWWLEEWETIFELAEREALEETNLIVKAEKLIYIREAKICWNYWIEFYVLCKPIWWELKLWSDPEIEKHEKQTLTNIKIFTPEDYKNNTWYPQELKEILFEDYKNNFPQTRYLGLFEF